MSGLFPSLNSHALTELSWEERYSLDLEYSESFFPFPRGKPGVRNSFAVDGLVTSKGHGK